MLSHSVVQARRTAALSARLRGSIYIWHSTQLTIFPRGGESISSKFIIAAMTAPPQPQPQPSSSSSKESRSPGPVQSPMSPSGAGFCWSPIHAANACTTSGPSKAPSVPSTKKSLSHTSTRRVGHARKGRLPLRPPYASARARDIEAIQGQRASRIDTAHTTTRNGRPVATRSTRVSESKNERSVEAHLAFRAQGCPVRASPPTRGARERAAERRWCLGSGVRMARVVCVGKRACSGCDDIKVGVVCTERDED